MKPVTPKQPVLFIGGLGRSGTTLVEKLLNELPTTFSVGETVHLWERGVRDNERCGCGQAFDSCPHWQAVGQEAFGGWDNVDLERMIALRWEIDRSRRLPQIFAAVRTGRTSKAQREYLHNIQKVLFAAAKVASNNAAVEPRELVLLDSSKHLSTAALLACDPRLDVRVLHLVRDPRGVAFSWTKTVARPETNKELMPQYSPRRTGIRWVTDNLGFEALERLGVPRLEMRYEDFLDAPTEAILKIARFAGAVPQSVAEKNGGGVLPFLAGKSAHLTTPMHSVAGNPLRFGGDNLTLCVDDLWKTELSGRATKTVNRVTGPVLARYGYSRSA